MTAASGRVFDARALPPAEAFAGTSTWRGPDQLAANLAARGWTPTPSISSASMELFEAERIAAGVNVTGLPARVPNAPWGGASNEAVRALVAADPLSRIWFAAVGGDESPEEIESLAGQGARGIVVEPFLFGPALQLDDATVDPLYDSIQALGLPVLVMLGGEYGVDVSWCDPVRVERVAQRFPRLDMVIVHAGWPVIQATLAVAYRCPRVWLLPDVYFPGLPGQADLVLALRTFLRDRVMYGSGYPYCPHAQQLEAIRSLGLPDDIESGFLFDNAARLLGLPAAAAPDTKENT